MGQKSDVGHDRNRAAARDPFEDFRGLLQAHADPRSRLSPNAAKTGHMIVARPITGMSPCRNRLTQPGYGTFAAAGKRASARPLLRLAAL